jgi:phospholipase/carboxylesterase
MNQSIVGSNKHRRKGMSALTSICHEATATHEYTIICLHGLGASGDDLAPLAQELALPNVRWVFPHAPKRPIESYGGQVMRAWHDRLNFQDHVDPAQLASQLDIDGVNESYQLISEVITQEAQKAPYHKLVLMGFSQGGAMAVYSGIHFPHRLAGMVGLSAYPAMAQLSFDQLAVKNKKTPVFLGHGMQDAVVKPSYGKALFDGLHARAYPVEWHTYPMAHSLCGQELQDLKQWLMQRVEVRV